MFIYLGRSPRLITMFIYSIFNTKRVHEADEQRRIAWNGFLVPFLSTFDIVRTDIMNSMDGGNTTCIRSVGV
jgi:hypothetical protein